MIEAKVNIEQIARVCHEANRAYCITVGDTSQVEWDAAQEWQRDSAKAGVRFQLGRINDMKRTDPTAAHESWMAQKVAEGWVYGPVKDAEKKHHPCMVPYSQLPFEQKVKDYIFCGIVEAFASSALDEKFS